MSVSFIIITQILNSFGPYRIAVAEHRILPISMEMIAELPPFGEEQALVEIFSEIAGSQYAFLRICMLKAIDTLKF